MTHYTLLAVLELLLVCAVAAEPPASSVVRLVELPSPWTNPLADNPYLRQAIVRHTAAATDMPGGHAVVVEARLKRSTDFPLPIWLRLHGLRAGVDYRVAFRDLEFRALAAETPLAIRPMQLRTDAGQPLRLAWGAESPAPENAAAGTRPIQLTIERDGQVFLKASTTLVGSGPNAVLSPLEIPLPRGLAGGHYSVIADTRRVPVAGQPSRRATVATVDVSNQPPPRTVKATVASYNGAATLHIDGRPVTALKYMTYRLDERYVRQFAEAGVEVVGFGAACGEHPYGLAADSWPAPDRFDFSELDARAARVLSAHPQAYLLVRVYVAAPKWWVQQYPDECVVSIQPDGTRRDYDEPAGHRPGSWASKRWRDDMGRGLGAFVQHLRSSPYADRVLGLLVCAGTTEEWMFAGSNFAEWADYSPPAVAGFRDWLRTRYGAEARLRAAWRDPQATFAAAAPPQLSAAAAAGTGEFVDPAQGARLPDWWHYTSDLTADTIEHSKSAKAGCF